MGRPRIQIQSVPTLHEAPCNWPSYLLVVSGNGQVVLRSETYSTRANARRAAYALLNTMYGICEQIPYDDADFPGAAVVES